MPSSGILLFETDPAAGGGGTSSYVQTEFLDTALPADSNSGLTSTVSTNPLGEFFANSVLPRYMAKTLWIKDLQVIEDRTKWLNNKPTYKIIWHEEFPGVVGYVCGGAQLSGNQQQKQVLLPGSGDLIGVTAVARRVQWIVKPAVAGTATLAVDGVAGSPITIDQFPSDASLNPSFEKVYFNAFTSSPTNETLGLHDYQLRAVTVNALKLYGVVVYFEVPGSGIDVPSGSVYIDKSLVNFEGTTLAFPAGISNFIGGVVGVFMGANGAPGITTTFVPNFTALGSGVSGSALLSVGIGLGGSFPAGTGLFIPSGATHYLGVVTSVSGDVLTVSPAFTFGISNTIHSIFQAGHTFSQVSGWTTCIDYNVGINPTQVGGTMSPYIENGGAQIFTNRFFYSSNYLNYAVVGASVGIFPGSSLSAGVSGQTFGIMPFDVSGGYLQIAGRMSALELEIVCGQSAIVGFTISIDGIGTIGLAENVGGPTTIRRRVFTNGGVGWHTVNIAANGNTQAMITRIIGLEPTCTNGPTLGKLAEIPLGMTLISRNSYGSSSTALGNVQRIYAPCLSGTDVTGSPTPLPATLSNLFNFPSSVELSFATDDVMRFSYFGTRFSLIGDSGATFTATVDGLAATPVLNGWMGTGLTLGFHDVELTFEADSSRLGAVDFYCPVMQLKSCLNYDQTPEISKKISFFEQPDEPQQAKPGDIWQPSGEGTAYQRLFGKWTDLNVDNPVCFYNPGSTKSIPNTGFHSMPYSTEIYDPFSMGSVGSTFTIIIPRDGSYMVSLASAFDVNGSGVRSVRIEQDNGVLHEAAFITPGASIVCGVVANIIIPNLKTGNKIVPLVAQNTSGALTLLQTGYFSCARIGP